MTTKMYNDGINKMYEIIFDANEKLVEIIKETFFVNIKEIELEKYIRLGNDCISRLELRDEDIWVYFPNYKKEYAWLRLTTFTPNQIHSLYVELCTRTIKNK